MEFGTDTDGEGFHFLCDSMAFIKDSTMCSNLEEIVCCQNGGFNRTYYVLTWMFSVLGLWHLTAI
jgi:hypothetical protein